MESDNDCIGVDEVVNAGLGVKAGEDDGVEGAEVFDEGDKKGLIEEHNVIDLVKKDVGVAKSLKDE